MKCTICQTDFTPARSTALYCSPACRVKASRLKDTFNSEVITAPTPPNETTINMNMDALKASLEKPKVNYYIDGEDIADQEYFLTGFAEFDAMSGIPKERISLIYGPEGVGKTTMMYEMVKNLSDQAKILYIDSEAAISQERLAALGTSQDKLHIRRDTLIEDAYDHIIDGLKDYDLIIVDSVTAFTFRAEVEGEATDSNMGRKALILNKLCRILPVLLQRYHCTVILVNQERDSFDGMGKTIPGGRGQTYASSHTVRLSTMAKDRFQRQGEVAGHWVTAEIRKSRFVAPWQKAKFQLFYN
jgi:RecA/RadA recombinase